MQLTSCKNKTEIKELLHDNEKTMSESTILLSCKEKEYKNNELQYQHEINTLKMDLISYKKTIKNINIKNNKLITEIEDKNDNKIKIEDK